MRKLLPILFFLIASPIFAQVTNSGQPKSWDSVGLDEIPTITMPEFDLEAIKAEDKINDKKRDIPWRFGYDFSVSYGLDNSGQWFDVESGGRVWLLKFHSEGAKTLNFLFDQYKLPDGATLYFYNEDKTDVLGAYTSSQNRKDLNFGSWLVDGDTVIVEYFEPESSIGQGLLNISAVVHGYRSAAQFKTAKALNTSGDCNIDVDCGVGSDFDDLKDELKNSVAMTVVGGSGFCTGTLINNTSNDGTQYFLTANHCVGGGVSNWAFRFNWISPNPSCATPASSTNGSFNQTASGAILRASNAKSDMALLEISPNLPDAWDLVWAGWDRSGNSPDYVVGIHHPDGDIMKICRDDDGPFQTQVSFGPEPNMEVWYINEWEQGVTEPGSSGSALFDENGRIVGQLAGGAAACSGTSNNGAYDFYGRFDVSWDFGSTASTRLSDWLDPNNTGEVIIDQYPAAQVFTNDARLIVTDLDSEICGTTAEPSFEVKNVGSNTITSIEFSYQVNSATPVNTNWTGNLAPNSTATITQPTLNINGSTTIQAAITSVNNNVDNNPVDNTYANTVNNFSGQAYQTTGVTFELLTDDYGEETTWELRDSSGNLIQSGPNSPYADTQNYSISLNVQQDECYNFIINDAASDGICCGWGQGSYELVTAENEVIFAGGQFTSSETTAFSVVSSLSTQQSNLEQQVSIYPNPTNSVINIENKSGLNYTYKMYSVTGQLLARGDKQQLSVNQLPQGLYLLQLDFENGQKVTERIIVK